MALLLINQEARASALAPNSVHTAILSPPYLSLRDYEAEGQLGKEPLHDCMGWVSDTAGAIALIQEALSLLTPESHLDARITSVAFLLTQVLDRLQKPAKPCGKCFVCNVRAWAGEVYRVLRPDGTLWLNIADSYNGSGGAGGDYNPGGSREGQPKFKGKRFTSLKPKDMMGIPWRVALALQADGWYLRSANIWHKPNCQPESATDRTSRDYEYMFMFSKQERYYFDMEAVRVKLSPLTKRNEFGHKDAQIFGKNKPLGGNMAKGKKWEPNPKGRHLRTVWKIPVARYGGDHFATYPPELVEPCIKAGTSEHGVCFKCGSPWRRVIKRDFVGEYNHREAVKQRIRNAGSGGVKKVTLGKTENIIRKTIGWSPTCQCYRTRNPKKLARQEARGDWQSRIVTSKAPVKPAIVYDPFLGSGTTLEVARRLGRNGIGGDLSYKYLTQDAQERLQIAGLSRWEAGKPKKKKTKKGAVLEPLPMFENL